MTIGRRLKCLIGLHQWVGESCSTYLWCKHCRKYNIWRSREWR